MQDKYQENLEKMDLLNKIKEEIDKILESKSKNPQKRVIFKKFDDKSISITVELEDPEESKGII